MDAHEVVLSEVHLGLKARIEGDAYRTRFPFRFDVEEEDDIVDPEDDDVSVKRRCGDSDVIVIRHSLLTNLSQVGLQVWTGALLLAEFFLSRPPPPVRCTRVWTELGSGTGLCGVAAALALRRRPLSRIYLTDLPGIVDLCSENIRLNSPMLRQRGVDTDFRVIPLDFLQYDLDATLGLNDDIQEDENAADFPKSLREMFTDTETFFASDVIFDPDVTEAFFEVVLNALTTVDDEFPKKNLYLSVEKRILFSAYDIDEPSAPLYDHFRACLEGLTEMKMERGRFSAKEIDLNFPQCFIDSYSRNEYLEIWEISFDKNA